MKITNPTDYWLIWLGGFCGTIGPILIISLVFASAHISPWFRWDTNAISALGVGEVSLLFNSTLIIGGILNLIFAIGLKEYLSKKITKVGVTLIILGSISLLLVGIFTVSYPTMHTIVALAQFTLPPIGIILIGYTSKENKIKKLSIITGIGALIAILILPAIFLALQINVGFAIPEIIEALIVSTWIIFMGIKL